MADGGNREDGECQSKYVFKLPLDCCEEVDADLEREAAMYDSARMPARHVDKERSRRRGRILRYSLSSEARLPSSVRPAIEWNIKGLS